MGERVAVNPGAPGEPQPRRVVPLGYGRGDNWFTRMGRYWAPFGAAADGVVRRRLGGGWRRVGFALGISLTAGGFGYGLAGPYHVDGTGFLTALGGLLIGLTVPIRAWDEPRA